MADRLRSNQHTKWKLEHLQQVFGMSFNEHGLLFNSEREIANMPSNLCYDWLHCYLASGGLIQYGLGQCLKQMSDVGIRVTEIDLFASEMSWGSIPRPPANYLKHNYSSGGVSSEPYVGGYASNIIGLLTVVHCDHMGSCSESFAMSMWQLV